MIFLWRISLVDLMNYKPILYFWEGSSLLEKTYIIITHAQNCIISLYNFCVVLLMAFYAYKNSQGLTHFIIHADLPPSAKSFVLQIAWIGILLQVVLWLLTFCWDQLALLLLYIFYIIIILVSTGDLILVLKYIVTDTLNLVYKILCGLCTYLYYFLFRQGMGPYTDHLLVVMFGDYLFMIIFAVISLESYSWSMRRPNSYTARIMLGFSIWFLYNSACVVFTGMFYSARSWESHMDNVCNVSSIFASLVYILLINLELFVARRCGNGVLLNTEIGWLDSWVRLMRNLSLVVCLTVCLVTLFYFFTEVHHSTNVRSGYVYYDVDLSSSHRWAFDTFWVLPEVLHLKIIVLFAYNLYSFYKVCFLISFLIRHKPKKKKTA